MWLLPLAKHVLLTIYNQLTCELKHTYMYVDLDLCYWKQAKHFLNFRGLVAAQGIQNPEKPILFMKPTSAYISEGQDIKVHFPFQL